MLCACIDIGSNTTRVLVAEVDGGTIRPVLERKAYTELGRDLRAAGAVSDARMRVLADVVADYAATTVRLGVDRTRTVATAAMRGAANRDAVLDCIRERAGVELEILPGEEEARLAFHGATRTLPAVPEGSLAVLDVGGGSSEIAVGTAGGGVSWACSLPIGSSYLAEAHQRCDPPSADEIAAMREHADSVFAARDDVPRPAAAAAVGGSATALCQMGGSVLDGPTLARAAQMVCDGPAEVVARRHGLDAERVRLLPAGILILDAAARRLGCALQVARGGLREGVCLALAGHAAP